MSCCCDDAVDGAAVDDVDVEAVVGVSIASARDAVNVENRDVASLRYVKSKQCWLGKDLLNSTALSSNIVVLCLVRVRRCWLWSSKDWVLILIQNIPNAFNAA